MIRLIYQGILNRLDQQLLFVQTFLFKPDYEWSDGFMSHIRVWAKREMIEFYDEDRGSIVWRIEYDPIEEMMRMHYGPTVEEFWYKGLMKGQDYEMKIFDVLKEHARSSVEKALLGE